MTDSERKYEQFGRLVMQEFADCEFGNDISGGWIQDVAERLGIIRPDADEDGEDGDIWYIFAEGMQP